MKTNTNIEKGSETPASPQKQKSLGNETPAAHPATTRNGRHTHTFIVFGPNLRDQSKGQFVVHEAGCRDCGKLRGETSYKFAAASMEEVAREWYGDQINESGSDEIDWAIDDMHFAPCVKIPRYSEGRD